MHHRLSSADYPQSNGRAEVTVKSAKRMIRENTNSDGSLNNDSAARAILQYRNTPLQDCNFSPAQILFHRQLRNTISCHPSNYQLHQEWIELAKEREHTYSRKNHAIAEEYNRRAHTLKPLSPGTVVLIQGKDGKWVKQGRIVEELEHRQYRIRAFGSGRILLRNRKFIKACSHSKPSELTLLTDTNPMSETEFTLDHERECSTPAGSTATTSELVPQDNSTSPINQPLRSCLKRTPRMLRNLRTFNNPGLKE